jgi:GPI-anchor transamidase subunit U
MASSTMTPLGKNTLYLAAAALRLLLFVAFPGLPDLLTGRVEISTPVTSFKRRTSNPYPFLSPFPAI